MKKLVWVLAIACLVFTFAGCKSKPPTSDGMPPEAANARRNAPEDVLVGIGNAKMGTVAQSRNIAATRARAEISNSMNSMVKNMVRDYTASSEVDPQAALSFQENITVTLSKSDLRGAVIHWEGAEKNGMWWCVMHLSKTSVVNEISQAQAKARLAVPAMASFDAEQRMNEAFEQARREGW
jgi:predicted small lipoprotein YifL